MIAVTTSPSANVHAGPLERRERPWPVGIGVVDARHAPAARRLVTFPLGAGASRSRRCPSPRAGHRRTRTCAARRACRSSAGTRRPVSRDRSRARRAGGTSARIAFQSTPCGMGRRSSRASSRHLLEHLPELDARRHRQLPAVERQLLASDRSLGPSRPRRTRRTRRPCARGSSAVGRQFVRAHVREHGSWARRRRWRSRNDLSALARGAQFGVEEPQPFAVGRDVEKLLLSAGTSISRDCSPASSIVTVAGAAGVVVGRRGGFLRAAGRRFVGFAAGFSSALPSSLSGAANGERYFARAATARRCASCRRRTARAGASPRCCRRATLYVRSLRK